MVGGVYRISGGELEEEGSDGESSSSSLPEYCSESEGMVIVDSVRGFSEAMASCGIEAGIFGFCLLGGELGGSGEDEELLCLLMVNCHPRRSAKGRLEPSLGNEG